MNERRLAVPFVAGIIERTHNGEKQLLLQTRWQRHDTSIYKGTLEFPAGVLDVEYESVFDAVAREVKEEAGLTVTKIQGADQAVVTSTGKGDETLGFSPYCCVQQLKGGKPWVGFIFLCEVKDGDEPTAQEGETREPRWVSVDTVREIITNSPENFFGLELPALQKYVGII